MENHESKQESVVSSLNNTAITLTNKRVYFESKKASKSNYISMTLDAVVSCGLITKSFPLLLIAAAISGVGGFTLRGDEKFAVWGIAIAFLVVYFLTRRSMISIRSKGGASILVLAKGVNRNSIIEFLSAIESEKLRLLRTVPS